MDRIIAGRFPNMIAAEAAASVITRQVDRSNLCLFHNNPPGQHGVLSTGGDENVDPGAEQGAPNAAGTALAAGLTAGAIGLIGGPVTALAAAGVAAYAGSLVGAESGLGDRRVSPKLPNRRPAGIILAVRITAADQEKRVIADLRSSGALDIEQASGEWLDGDWIDFNPVQEPHLVAA